MNWRPPKSTRTAPLCPDTTLFRSLGTAHRKEGHFGLAGDSPCQESLPCPRRTDQQHAFRCCPAKPGVFLRPLEEVDDFHQLVLRLVDPSDVRKGDRKSTRLNSSH